MVGNWERMQSLRLVVRRRKEIPEELETSQNGGKELDSNRSTISSSPTTTILEPLESTKKTENHQLVAQDWEKKLETYLHSSSANVSSTGLMSSRPTSGATTPRDKSLDRERFSPVNSGLSSMTSSFVEESETKQVDPVLVEEEKLEEKLKEVALKDAVEEDEEEDSKWELVEVGRALANYTSIECERIRGVNR